MSNGWAGKSAPRSAIAASAQSAGGDARIVPVAMNTAQRAGDHLSHGPISARATSSRPRNPWASRRRRTTAWTDIGDLLLARSLPALRRVDVDACHAILARHLLLGRALERIEPLSDLDAVESDVLEQPQELCLRQSAADSTGPQIDVAPYGIRQLRRDHDVRIEEATTRAEDPQHLGEGAPLVGREVQHAIGDDDIGGGALDRKVESVAAPQIDIGESRLGYPGLRLPEHRVRHVYSDGATLGPDRVRRQEKVRPGTAPDGHTRRPRCDRLPAERVRDTA